LWHHEQQTLDTNLRANFDFSVRQTTSRIEQRLAAYEQMLRGARGLFNASSNVTHADFQRYVDALTDGGDFAGLQVMVFSARQAGNPMTAPITYVAPSTPLNRKALSQNLYAEPVRRAAMLQARDSGTIAITPKVRLLMDDAQTLPGFAMFLAIYTHNHPVNSLAARQASLYGWVHVAFRLHDLMASLYGEGTPGIALRIYDGVRTDPEGLMFDSHPNTDKITPVHFEALEYISFPQHSWTLQILSTPEFEQRYSHDSAHIIAIAGSGVSLLLAVLTWQLATGRARAFARAQAMTRELRESEERMRHMAQHDPLTHLPNRALFSDRLQAALARARRDSAGAGLMFVDLDHFKPVNDAYGHAVGDHLLVAATKRMRDCLRESDTLARVGGDEFVVLLPHIDTRDDARLVAERIRTSLALPFLIDNHALAISASIGIGIFPEHGSDDVTLIKSADDAMYRAKDAGRDRLVFAD
jgi:diguanylate cyclase (GGDEF)-like protein